VAATTNAIGHSGIRRTWRSGIRDLVRVVEVVRDVAGQEASRGRSAREKRILAKARLILLQEMTVWQLA